MTAVDNPDAARAAIERRDKVISTLRARCALAGFAMAIIDGGHGVPAFVLGRWGRWIELPDLAAVAAFLDQAGAAP